MFTYFENQHLINQRTQSRSFNFMMNIDTKILIEDQNWLFLAQ